MSEFEDCPRCGRNHRHIKYCGWNIGNLLDHTANLERQLEEAREDVKTYKYDLETLVSIVTECVYDMSEEERYDTLKQVADHYKQLKEKDDE